MSAAEDARMNTLLEQITYLELLKEQVEGQLSHARIKAALWMERVAFDSAAIASLDFRIDEFKSTIASLESHNIDNHKEE